MARIVVALGHPNRLPILIALEDRAMTAVELVAETGFAAGAVDHAIKVLRRAGLVVVREQRLSRNLPSYVYGTPQTGWASVLDALTQAVRSSPPR